MRRSRTTSSASQSHAPARLTCPARWRTCPDCPAEDNAGVQNPFRRLQARACLPNTARALVTREEIVAFAAEYDPQPMHLDEEAGAQDHARRAVGLGLAHLRAHDAHDLRRLSARTRPRWAPTPSKRCNGSNPSARATASPCADRARDPRLANRGRRWASSASLMRNVQRGRRTRR